MRAFSTPFSVRAFSLLEALVTVAILGVVSTIALIGARDVSDGSRVTKLESDVATVNHAIKMYIASGGTMSDVTAPQEILDKLKTERADANAGTFAGFTGTMIDKRLCAEPLDDADVAGDSKRAIWEAGKNRFKIVSAGSGAVSRFFLDEGLALVDYGEEERGASSLDLNSEDGWIWAYTDSQGATPPGPSLIPISGGGSTGGSAGSDPGGPQQLLVPTFSQGGGAFHYSEFPLSLRISNPNSALSSWTMVSTGGAFSQYSGPISVTPDMVVSAYTTGDSALWTSSSTVIETYTRESYELQPPTIAASPSTQFDSATSEITISLSDPNPAGLAKIVYWLSTSTTPVDYTAPFVLNAADHPDGVTVHGRAIGLDTFVVDSAQAQLPIINAERTKLDPPTIALSDTTFDEETSIIMVTLTNPNPSDSSQIYYALKDPAAGYPPVASYSPYSGTFSVTSDQYPDGFHIQTYAKSLDTLNYTDSDFAEAVTTAEFFDVALTGDVLFILDASGSMTRSHGAMKRFNVVIQETINAINGLSETQKFSVVLFNSGIRWTDGSGTLKLATANNKEKMIEDLLEQSASGGTNYGTALAEAFQFDVYPTQVLFLSDGLPNYNNYRDEVATLASLGIPVDTVGIGSLDSQAPLQEIADLTGGTFTFIAAPGSGGKHSSPTFSVDGGAFDYTAFPMVVSLTNPNSTLDPNSFIRYSVNGGGFNTYAGPLSLGYEMTVEAFVDTSDPVWAKSDRHSESYSVLSYSLTKPGMTLSSDSVGGGGGPESVTVTLTDPNPAGLSNLFYWFENETEADSGCPYTGPFTVTAEIKKGKVQSIQYPVSRAFGTESFVINSPITSAAIDVDTGGNSVPLDPVKFLPDGNRFDYTEFPLTVNLSDENNLLTSYILVSINGGDFTAYTTPLILGYNTTVKAYIDSPSNAWDKSEERTMFYEVKTVDLDEPVISLSDDKFETKDATITLTLTNRNSSAISSLIWWFEGQDEATEAVAYTAPVTLVASAWEAYNPGGGDKVKIYTRAVGTQSFAENSKTKDKEIENKN